MTRIISNILKIAVCLALVSGGLYSVPAAAQVIVMDEGPPPDFIATTQPVYFEGRAAYWWNNRWWFRDGPRWGWYHEEPAFLRDHRDHHEPVRAYYRGGDVRHDAHGFERHR